MNFVIDSACIVFEKYFGTVSMSGQKYQRASQKEISFWLDYPTFDPDNSPHLPSEQSMFDSCIPLNECHLQLVNQASEVRA